MSDPLSFRYKKKHNPKLRYSKLRTQIKQTSDRQIQLSKIQPDKNQQKKPGHLQIALHPSWCYSRSIYKHSKRAETATHRLDVGKLSAF